MTHHAANKYCQWLSAKTGQFYRLPTEAEWEYACRGGTTTRFYWGDDPFLSTISHFAWWSKDSGFSTRPVGSLGPGSANAWGLFDMSGNVFQWCEDWYGPYAAGAQTDPRGPAGGTSGWCGAAPGTMATPIAVRPTAATAPWTTDWPASVSGWCWHRSPEAPESALGVLARPQALATGWPRCSACRSASIWASRAFRLRPAGVVPLSVTQSASARA